MKGRVHSSLIKEVKFFDTFGFIFCLGIIIPRGAGVPVVVRDVPAAADHATTLANIEAERQKAVRPLRLAMAANAARLNELDILVSL